MNAEEMIRQLKQDYVDVFSTEKGIRVFEDLSKKAYMHKSTFSENPGRMGVNEGMRMIVLHIENMQKLDVKKAVEQYQQGGEQ